MVSAGEAMLPAGCDAQNVTVFSKLSEFCQVKVEPVGRWFEHVYINRRNLKEGPDDLDSSMSSDEASESEELDVDPNYLRKLDPKNWKSQDHYAVLGLQKLRYKARDEEIKKAYRKIVLRHHPDKRRSTGENVKDLDHDYFSCITKAYEILGNPVKRMSYDSVDPEFDEEIPSCNNYSKEHFFETFESVFSINSRWSVKKPVPQLGNKESTFEEVEKFYSFWYDFDSWREFSYLDEEEKEKGENREERKWIEKQNKIVRQKRKKEEMARIRQLVDNAYACDPRIQKFKEEEKQRKIAQKRAKQEAARLKAEEDERIRQEALEAERKAKEKEEEEAKLKREKEKKEKEALKKQQKKERKLLQQICEKNNYFATDEESRISHLKEVDRLCKLLPLEELQNLNVALQKEENTKRRIFLDQVESLNKQLEIEKEQLAASFQKSSSSENRTKHEKPWSHDDLQLLVKGVNLFPAGTINRWEVIVAFMAQHSTSNIQRTAKEVLAKAKELQQQSGGLKEQVNKNAYETMEKSQKSGPIPVKDQSTPTERFDAAEQSGVNSAAWTAEEQQLLEQALKTYPPSTEDRWDKIAACIPTRGKKDCVKRYKDLVEMVRAKKAVQASVQKGKK